MNRHGILTCAALALTLGAAAMAWGQSPRVERQASPTPLERAIGTGDLNQVRALLQRGTDPNQVDSTGNHPLADAVAAGRLEAVRILLAAGAKVDAGSPSGKTALIEAAEHNSLDAARLLIAAGANLNLTDRGLGTALETAERAGYSDMAALLRNAGARTAGRSVGDKVCVRPWNGDGFCGTVEAISQSEYRIRVTDVVGCRDGCSARADCSAGKPVGGAQGLHPGDTVAVPGSCLTHTGVRP
jgi:ankyrin repeat protein